MGFAVQSIEYMNNNGQQASGSRALGNTGANNYWTRVTVRTDGNGCSAVNVYLDAICYNGVVNQYYAGGAQLFVSTSATPGSYVGSAANLAATYMGNNQQRWVFSGTVSVNMQANTTYYLFVLPCWTEADTFVRYLNSDIAVTAAANWPNYVLSVIAGAGSSISVYRNASQVGAATGYLNNGSTIFYGDNLVIFFAASVGYQLSSTTVNGTSFPSGGSMTVLGAVSVQSAATRLAYTLTINADANSLVTVTRGGSALQSGDTIYYGDALTVTAAARSGYEVASAEINGNAFTGTQSVSVTGGVVVVVTSSALGFAYLYHSGAFIPYLIYLWHLSAWTRYRAYIWKNGAWTAY